jgi:hypothetical protein
MVTELKNVYDDEKLADALICEPEDIVDAMRQWRTLRDHITDVENSVAEEKEKVKYLESFISARLTVPEDGKKSETISVPGAGSVYKEKLITVKVTDWEKWRKYLIRHGFSAVTRQQNNIAPLQDLYDMIMDGALPMPQAVEFDTFEKPRFRRN